MRLIDRDSITFQYDGLAFIAPDDFTGIAKYFYGQIKQRPEINPVHAAGGCYCRECKYYQVYTGGCDAASHGTCARVKWFTEEDDFCSRGRRREDAE